MGPGWPIPSITRSTSRRRDPPAPCRAIGNQPEDLVGRQIVGVINFPEKQIGPVRSQFLLTGFHTDDGVVITTTERVVPNGTRLA
jgi:hypothetical protein